MTKEKILQAYLWFMGIFLLFWWPLSHWFYPDWYHQLLGFESYDEAMVKIIGTAGIVPVLSLFFAARNPTKNRDMITVLIVFSFLMAGTYVFLIQTQSFPVREYLNVALSIVSGIILMLLFPRKAVTQ
jgi:hypothetical protein